MSFLIIISCEKDDICPDSTQTTPQLVVTFYDALDPQQSKIVESLAVYAIKDSELILIENINGINTDSIAIPLRNDIGASNFRFIRNYSVENNIIFGDLSHIYIDYEMTDVFISRACGFITNYSLLSILNDNYADTWITESEIVNPVVTNENQAHVKILH
ncbi:MAG: DUF6452 family protein [Flavobacteriaceae bacterium]|jgi:hypothetical protein|nr:DUF6452 family protein [Flavobacteriaceae bacterium]